MTTATLAPRSPSPASRRLILEVRFGHGAGHKAVVAPGSTLTVGRTPRADFVIERDAELSGVHFELAWDGATCTLRDLESARGTSLGGAPIDGEAKAPHGAWIKAGETSFHVFVEGHTPSRVAPADPAAADPALATLAPRVKDAVDVGVSTSSRLFAVLDGARDRRVRELCCEHVDETRSLYEGIKGDALAEVAPRLVAFARGSEMLARLVREGWGKSWGVFLESGASFTAVRRQLRRLLLVEEAETSKRMYFRFYDPRVLREFLPVATPRQSDELFADVIDRFLLEGEDGKVMTFAPLTSHEGEG